MYISGASLPPQKGGTMEQRSEIENLLRTYLEKKSRIKFLELDIEGLKKMLEYKGTKHTVTKEEAIESIVLKPNIITDTPKGNGTSEYQSSTEKAALNYEKEMEHINNFDTDKIYSKIRQLQKEIDILKVDVNKVDIFLSGLTEREKFIAEKFYIHGWTWEEVTYYYNQKFPIAKGIRALKDYRNSLIEKINRISA